MSALQDLKKGDILLSDPNILGDLTFNRSIILIVDYNKEGVVGFIVNKPMDEKLNDLIPEIQVEFKVFDGGPVEQDKLYFIHNVPEIISDGIEIGNGLYWGGSYSEITKNINSGTISSKHIKFFLGYSGWGTNQLQDEIMNKVWLKHNDIETLEILSYDTTSVWNEKIKELGGDYLIWSNAPDNFNYN